MRRLVRVADTHLWIFEQWKLELPLYVGDDGAVYAAVRQVSQAFGLSATAQLTRMREDKDLLPGVVEMPVETDGGIQRTVCIRRKEMAWWLATIDQSKCRPDIRNDLDLIKGALMEYADALVSGRVRIPALPAPPPARRVIALSSRDVIVLDCDCGRRWRVTVVNGEATIEPEG